MHVSSCSAGIAYARRRISRTVFRVDLPVMDWALGAQSLTPRGCMLSRRDNLLLHQRLSLEDPTLETRFPDERLRELYVYGRAFYNDSTLYEEDVEAPLQELPVRVYVDTIGRARTALVTLLGLQRRRNAASLIGLLPRDLGNACALTARCLCADACTSAYGGGDGVADARDTAFVGRPAGTEAASLVAHSQEAQVINPLTTPGKLGSPKADSARPRTPKHILFVRVRGWSASRRAPCRRAR